MSDPSWHFAERLMDLHVEEEQRRAEGQRLARMAGGNSGPTPAQRGRWWVAEVGFKLVVLGAWLEARAQPTSLVKEQRLGTSR